MRFTPANGAPSVGPVFTIVTPSLNQSAFIEQTILSVQAQNYPRTQHIVVDGGSLDGTIEILERYEGSLAWWVSEKDGGQSDAIHKGFLRSTGDILCWLNADDVLLPGALTTVAQYFSQHPEKDVVNGGCYFIDSEGRPVSVGRVGFTLGVRASFDRLRLYGNEGLHQPATFWRRHAYFEVGGLDERLHYSMDLDLFTRLARRGRFGVLPRMLACARRHPGCKTIRERDACRCETAEIAARYRGEGAVGVLTTARRCAYRTADRVRKLALWVRHKSGLLQMAAVHFAELTTPPGVSPSAGISPCGDYAQVPSEMQFCTYTDRRYLPRALALYESLRAHCGRFRLWVLCLDQQTLDVLKSLDLAAVRPIAMAELERWDPELARARHGRSTLEYYFTCTPVLPLYVLDRAPGVDLITYLDADLFFFSNPRPLFAEIGHRAIAIVPHRFPPDRGYLQSRFGIFNVGLVSFRRQEPALACLRHWREQCLEWCFVRVEGDRFADQKYLDNWPRLFGDEVAVLDHPGADLAPWNIATHQIDMRDGQVHVDGRPLVFFHFHGVRRLRPGVYDLGLQNYNTRASGTVLSGIYAPYLQAVARAGRDAAAGGFLDTLLPAAARPPAPWKDRLRKLVKRGHLFEVTE